jgi:hypothetical protein
MIVFPGNLLKRPIGRWQNALAVSGSLLRPAIFGIRLYGMLFQCLSAALLTPRKVLPDEKVPPFPLRRT